VLQRYIYGRDTFISLETENFTLSFANKIVDDAIAQHTWVLPNGHGVDGAGWSPISSSVLRDHLTYVKGRSDAKAIWVETVANVAKYVKERTAAQVLLTASTNGACTFTVQCPTLNAAIYDAALTIKVNTGDITATTATATRGTTPLPVVIKPGYLMVDVVPGATAVTVTYQ
jgi:hypothetical protein